VLSALVAQVMLGAAQTLGTGHLRAFTNAVLATEVSLNGSGVLRVNAILKVLAVPGIVTVTDSVQFKIGISDQPAGRVTVRDGVS